MDNKQALRNALGKLLGQGEAASNNKMKKMHAAKNAPPAAAPEMCPECTETPTPLVEGKCASCGYEKTAEGGDEAGLADLLEAGATEG